MATTIVRRSWNVARRDFRRLGRSLSAVDSHLHELRSAGLSVVPSFVPPEECDALREEVDRILDRYQDKLERDETGSDTRAWAADRVSARIKAFADNPFVLEVGRRYMGAPDLTTEFTLANRVVPVPGNLGSGGGWHTDTTLDRQFKSLLYLGDVEKQTGPFEFFPGSHRVATLAKLVRSGLVQFDQHRFTPDEITRIADRIGPPTPVVGAKGTLILVDTSVIHRGRPIESGVRYALTNYIFERETIEKHRATGKFVTSFIDGG